MSTSVRADRRTTIATTLSPAECRVLELLASGLPDKGIARSLSIEVGTVKSHLRSAYLVLGAHGRVHAVVEALRRGAITVQGLSAS